MTTIVLLLAGLAVAAVIFVATGGHLVILPLFFVLPLGFFGLARRRR